MNVIPVVRHLIACKKEPTMNGLDPSVHDILYAVRPKANFEYPVWQRSFYLFAMVADGRGLCEFQSQMRLVELSDDGFEVESVIASSTPEIVDLGSQPLRVWFFSIELPPARLPQAGLYRVYLMVDGEEVGADVFHAR